MLGTRIACPHCNRSFVVNSAPPDPSQAPAAPAASAEPNAPAPVVDVVTPKPPPKSNIAASVERTGSDAYDLKPDPEPEEQRPKPSKPATPAIAPSSKPAAGSPKPAAAAPPPPAVPPVTAEKPSKGLFARLFSRSR